jgi:hypothetical protein
VAFGFTLIPAHLTAQDATPAAAPDPPAFLLEPVDHDGAYFTITQDPGTSQEFTVALGNGGTAPVTARTYVADAYTLANGGFGVETADDPTSEPATWIDYPTETLDLATGERIERAFTVTIPENTAPGQYIAGLAIETAEPIAVGENEAFRQIIKKAIAVFITVPGPETPELAIGEASVRQTATSNNLVIEVRNPGNIFLNPSGTVTMTTEDGEPVLTAPITMGSVYAGMNTTLELSIPTILEAGTYTVSVALEDEETGVSAEVTDVPVTVAEPPAAATPLAEPVTIESVALDPLTDPDTDELQAVNVGVTLENPGATIPSAQLTLHVTRNGELVEDYPLNSSLVVQAGNTEIAQRYVPLGSWEPGTYSFALILEAVDPNSGQVTVLATQSVEETIEAP